MYKQHAPSNHVEQPSEGSDTAPAASVEHWRDRHPPVRPGVVALALAVDGEETATADREKVWPRSVRLALLGATRGQRGALLRQQVIFHRLQKQFPALGVPADQRLRIHGRRQEFACHQGKTHVFHQLSAENLQFRKCNENLVRFM